MADEYSELLFKDWVKLMLYHRLFVPYKVWRIRHQDAIDVVFVLSELGVWKTESLYKAMLEHPRFSPHLAIVSSLENPAAKASLLEYVRGKGYDYADLGENEAIKDHFNADIIFYQKSYDGIIPDRQRMYENKTSLFCYVAYAFYSLIQKWSINQFLLLFAWQVYMENGNSTETLSRISLVKGRNFKLTGLPMEDDFLKYDSSRPSPWKEMSPARRRIIWAPHHTLPDKKTWLTYSTFLNYCDFMLDLAEKYRDKIQIAFKPHPLLRPRLDNLWGKEKTDEYFGRWESGENTQLCEGEYVDLFMHSDALVHDCGSFTIEYHYTHKPALYLDNGQDHTANMIPYAAEAYNLHYHANSKEDIEQFILNVIDGIDDKRAEREEYISKYLTPPGGSACDNIINAILGKELK